MSSPRGGIVTVVLDSESLDHPWLLVLGAGASLGPPAKLPSLVPVRDAIMRPHGWFRCQELLAHRTSWRSDVAATDVTSFARSDRSGRGRVRNPRPIRGAFRGPVG